MAKKLKKDPRFIGQGEIILTEICDEHGRELTVKDIKNGIEYLCWPAQCLGDTGTRKVGEPVQILSGDNDFPYYIGPLPS